MDPRHARLARRLGMPGALVMLATGLLTGGVLLVGLLAGAPAASADTNGGLGEPPPATPQATGTAGVNGKTGFEAAAQAEQDKDSGSPEADQEADHSVDGISGVEKAANELRAEMVTSDGDGSAVATGEQHTPSVPGDGPPAAPPIGMVPPLKETGQEAASSADPEPDEPDRDDPYQATWSGVVGLGPPTDGPTLPASNAETWMLGAGHPQAGQADAHSPAMLMAMAGWGAPSDPRTIRDMYPQRLVNQTEAFDNFYDSHEAPFGVADLDELRAIMRDVGAREVAILAQNGPVATELTARINPRTGNPEIWNAQGNRVDPLTLGGFSGLQVAITKYRPAGDESRLYVVEGTPGWFSQRTGHEIVDTFSRRIRAQGSYSGTSVSPACVSTRRCRTGPLGRSSSRSGPPA